MAKISLASVARHCDRLLRTDDFGDWEGAVNGLQVENRGAITRVAAAVDASLATVKLAVAAKADLIINGHMHDYERLESKSSLDREAP